MFSLCPVGMSWQAARGRCCPLSGCKGWWWSWPTCRRAQQSHLNFFKGTDGLGLVVGTYKAQCGKGFLWVSWRGKCLRKSWTGGRSFRRISSRHTKLINWDGFLFLYLYQVKAESREKLSSSAPHATVSMGNPNEASGTLFPGGKRHFTTLCVEGSYLYDHFLWNYMICWPYYCE